MPSQPCVSSDQDMPGRGHFTECGGIPGDRLHTLHRMWQVCEEMSDESHGADTSVASFIR